MRRTLKSLALALLVALPLWSMAQARPQLGARLRARMQADAGTRVVPLPPGARRIADLAYGSDAAQRLDVYVPAHASGPIIVMVHGGGWRDGDKALPSVVDNKIAHWVAAGTIFISIDYRMLPGTDPLADRLAAHRARDEIAPQRLEPAVEALSSALRDRVRATFGLPPQETVRYEVVTDKPWSGFNYYLGDFCSRVAINADLGHRMANLPHLVAHEAYPGHHTEHCRKEAGLVRTDHHEEQTIFLVNTPQCLMAEGLADLGLAAAVGPGWGPWAAEILADLGLRMDGELAERLETAAAGLLGVRQDAALMLHDQHADLADVSAYLQRWLMVPEPRASQILRFLGDPLWRAYTSTYVEGYRLLSTWLADRPPAQALGGRYLRLLDEPLIPSVIRAELAGS